MIRKNDIVRIKPQWRDQGDERLTWIAREDEADGIVRCSVLEQRHMPLWPVYTIHTHMIEESAS
ncbi:MAG TPA: hypothetical protein VFI48_11475 [Hyphomicrobiaceae bacterium]|nr:hypothetical protein [Hyphomicrobiaceae bacterium]